MEFSVWVAVLTGRLWQTHLRHCPKLFQEKEEEPEWVLFRDRGGRLRSVRESHDGVGRVGVEN